MKQTANKVFDICLASIKQPQNDWLVKLIASPLVSLYLYLIMIGKEATECQLINSINVSIKKLKETRIQTIVDVNVPVSL